MISYRAYLIVVICYLAAGKGFSSIMGGETMKIKISSGLAFHFPEVFILH